MSRGSSIAAQPDPRHAPDAGGRVVLDAEEVHRFGATLVIDVAPGEPVALSASGSDYVVLPLDEWMRLARGR